MARVELGGTDYMYLSRVNGQTATGLGIKLAPGSNAVDTTRKIRQTMTELAQYFPAGVTWDIPYETSTFVEISIKKVVTTLLEAIALVFCVMYLFMQNFRATLIPTLVVPVALLGTLGVMLGLGYSINVLTMFGMVLAIGILVDDAIVVVENVERIMAEEGLSPHDATVKAMGQISGAIIGITVVLVSVFVPMAFFDGAVGNIYRQFSVTLAVSIAFSAFLALSLTPALCATMLRPIPAGHHEARLLRLVQPRLRPPDRRLHRARRRRAVAPGALRPGLRRRDRGGGAAVRAPALFLPAGRRPGQLQRHGHPAAGRDPGRDPQAGAGSRELHDEARTRAIRVFRQRLQRIRQRPELGHVLRHAEGLEGTPRRGHARGRRGRARQ